MYTVIRRFKQYGFLFSELVKRDFKKKYKRTFLGMLWSLLSPLLTLLIMRIIFTRFFGEQIEHYTIYLFCGNIIFSFFSDATGAGMVGLMENADVFTTVNVPKYLFVLSKNVSSLINFSLTFLVFLLFCAIDRVQLSATFLLLPYPIICLIIFNVGTGLLLSALFVYFRDVQYLWGVFITMLTYVSAIFYTIDGYAEWVQRLFLFNPVYVYIKYFRLAVLNATVPSPEFHLLAAFYALFALFLGCLIYRLNTNKFVYYV